MSGVVLPQISGALPSFTRSLPNGFDSKSRPSSSGSNASGYTIVPHVYYGSHGRTILYFILLYASLIFHILFEQLLTKQNIIYVILFSIFPHNLLYLHR